VHPKYLAGLIAVGGYIGIIGLVFFYFGYHSEKKSTHFVSENSNAIAVTLQAPRRTKTQQKKMAKPKAKSKKVKRSKPKAIQTPKPTKVKPKSKPIKRKKPIKKIKAKSLFSDIKTAPKSKTKPPKKPTNTKSASAKKSKKTSKVSRDSLKRQQAKDKGIENRYLAGVQEKLYGWPSQSNFAGATITIGLTIHSSGRFKYVVLTPSSNPEFDRTIEHYLKQLMTIGFDPTPKGKSYEFKVDIVAK
jgi:outer membrane biosynthesis protein TonB